MTLSPSCLMQDFFFFSLKQLETTTTGDRELNWMNSVSNVITVSILPKKHDEVINVCIIETWADPRK